MNAPDRFELGFACGNRRLRRLLAVRELFGRELAQLMPELALLQLRVRALDRFAARVVLGLERPERLEGPLAHGLRLAPQGGDSFLVVGDDARVDRHFLIAPRDRFLEQRAHGLFVTLELDERVESGDVDIVGVCGHRCVSDPLTDAAVRLP